MYILGINFSHHGSICLLKDGEVIFFLEEERLSRKKCIFINDKNHKVISKIKEYTNKLDYICVGFDRKSVIDFKSEADKCISQSLDDGFILNFDKEVIKNYTNSVIDLALMVNSDYINEFKEHDGSYFVKYTNLIWESLSDVTTKETKLYLDVKSHHNLHASQTFYNSGFDEAVCVVADGCGTSKFDDVTNTLYERESIWKFDYNNYKQLYCNYNTAVNGIGSTYTRVTGELGFQNVFQEGKTMGLSSYKPNDVDSYEWSNKIQIARNLQQWSQEQVLNLIKHAIEISGSKNVCLSGGYGLNCVANYYFRKNLPSDVNLYCEPIANDAGQAIGLAKKLHHKLTGDTTIRPQKSIYYGPDPVY